MKAVILAGGYGTRLSESTVMIPKPMVEVGGKPILWHIMKIYSHFGINDFVICLGYKQYVIKEYFSNYFNHNSDLTVDLSDNSIIIHQNNTESWKVTLVDTGLNTMTGGRIKRIQSYIGDERFLLTYGDGVADVDVMKTINFHESSGNKLTIMAYQPGGRLGVLDISDEGSVRNFIEKPTETGTWINAGFFVCEPDVFDYINGDKEMWENEPMSRMLKLGLIGAYKHTGFWKPMDTLRDCNELNKMWDNGEAKWKVW